MSNLIQLLTTAAQMGGKFGKKADVQLRVEQDAKGTTYFNVGPYLPGGKLGVNLDETQPTWVFPISSGNLDGMVASFDLNGHHRKPAGAYSNLELSKDRGATWTIVGFVQEPQAEVHTAPIATRVAKEKAVRKKTVKAVTSEPAQTPAGPVETTPLQATPIAPAVNTTASEAATFPAAPATTTPTFTNTLRVGPRVKLIKSFDSGANPAVNQQLSTKPDTLKPRPAITFTPKTAAPQVQQPKVRINRDVVESTSLDQLIYPETRSRWSGRGGRGIGLRQHCAILMGLAQELVSLHAQGIYVGYLRPQDIQFSFISVSKLEVQVKIWVPEAGKKLPEAVRTGLLWQAKEINEQYMHPQVLAELQTGTASADTMAKADWFCFGQIAFMLLLGCDPFLTGEVTADNSKSGDRPYRMAEGLWFTRLGKVTLADEEARYYNDLLNRVTTLRDLALKGLSLKLNEKLLAEALGPDYLKSLGRCSKHSGMYVHRHKYFAPEEQTEMRQARCFAMLEHGAGSCRRCGAAWHVQKRIKS